MGNRTIWRRAVSRLTFWLTAIDEIRPKSQVRTGLPAGGRWIRTLGPPCDRQRISRLPVFDHSGDYASATEDRVLREGVPVSVYNLPLCVLDRSVWHVAAQSISDWKNAYLPVCTECKVRPRCAGFFSTGRMRTSRRIKAMAVSDLEAQICGLSELTSATVT
jgi:hypothetical protein